MCVNWKLTHLSWARASGAALAALFDAEGSTAIWTFVSFGLVRSYLRTLFLDMTPDEACSVFDWKSFQSNCAIGCFRDRRWYFLLDSAHCLDYQDVNEGRLGRNTRRYAAPASSLLSLL